MTLASIACRRTDFSPQPRTGERPQLSGHFGLALDGLDAVLEPVAWTVDRDHFAVLQEAVEDGGGQHLVAEDLAPSPAKEEQYLLTSLEAPAPEPELESATAVRHPAVRTEVRIEHCRLLESKKSTKARGMKSPDRSDVALLAVYEPEPDQRRRVDAAC